MTANKSDSSLGEFKTIYNVSCRLGDDISRYLTADAAVEKEIAKLTTPHDGAVLKMSPAENAENAEGAGEGGKEDCVVLELKSTAQMAPVFPKQLRNCSCRQQLSPLCGLCGRQKQIEREKDL